MSGQVRPRLDGMRGLGAVFLLGAGSVCASPACIEGTLFSYIALGTEGCSFQSDGAVTFTEQIAFRSFGYSGDSEGIRVSPDLQPWAPGLKLFGIQGGSIDARLTFEVDAPAESAGLLVNGFRGGIAAAESVCVGAAFGADGSCAAGAVYTSFANGPRAAFPAVEVLGVTDHFVPAPGASAVYFESNISRATPYGFCECAFEGGEPVPEPGPAWLLGAGLILLVLAALRK